MYVEDVTSIVGPQFLLFIGFEQGYGIRRLYQCFTWAIPNCCRHPTTVKDAHGTELATFQAECYGLHLLRVLVEATRLQLSGMKNLKASKHGKTVGVTEETVPETLPNTMPEYHALAWWLQRLPCIPDDRICHMPRLHFTDPEWEVSRFTTVNHGLSVTSASVTSLPQFQLAVGVFFGHDRTNCKAVHTFLQAEVKRSCNSTTYCSVKIVKLTLLTLAEKFQFDKFDTLCTARIKSDAFILSFRAVTFARLRALHRHLAN